jgi:hypothetical protein
MKKLTYLLTVLFAVFLISCNEENVNSVIPKEENQVMKFDSEAEMQSKITEIVEFKKNQELQIIDKILKRNNLKAPTLADISTISKASNLTTDKAAIMDALTFYHTEKLKAIYEERAHFNFTSIQSIADEINSLKLLNTNKAVELIDTYSGKLKTTPFLILPNFDDALSNVINSNGKVTLNGKEIEPISNPTSTTLKFIKNVQLKEGILAQNENYAITWHAGVNEHSDDVGRTFFKGFTKLGSFIKVDSQIIPYPSWFFTDPSSCALFCYGFNCYNIRFPEGPSYILENESKNSTKFSLLRGHVFGTFVTVVNGQFWQISGAKTF